MSVVQFNEYCLHFLLYRWLYSRGVALSERVEYNTSAICSFKFAGFLLSIYAGICSIHGVDTAFRAYAEDANEFFISIECVHSFLAALSVCSQLAVAVVRTVQTTDASS